MKTINLRLNVCICNACTYPYRAGQSKRHEQSWQFTRRRHLAIARNRLLMHALGSVGPRVRWVLWIDSDVRHIPRDLVRHLVAVNQSVVVPNCLWKQDNGQVISQSYDYLSVVGACSNVRVGVFARNAMAEVAGSVPHAGDLS